MDDHYSDPLGQVADAYSSSTHAPSESPYMPASARIFTKWRSGNVILFFFLYTISRFSSLPTMSSFSKSSKMTNVTDNPLPSSKNALTRIKTCYIQQSMLTSHLPFYCTFSPPFGPYQWLKGEGGKKVNNLHHVKFVQNQVCPSELCVELSNVFYFQVISMYPNVKHFKHILVDDK